MKSTKNYFLIMGLLLCYNVYSQNSESVTIKVASKISDTITERARKTIILNVQNLSKNYIEIHSVPIMHVDYEVLKKIGNNYIMDSNCIFMPMPMYPGDNYKGIKIEKGKDLDIPMSFPPMCTFFDNEGTYRVKYFFTYTFRRKAYTVETKWYQFSCMFSL